MGGCQGCAVRPAGKTPAPSSALSTSTTSASAHPAAPAVPSGTHGSHSWISALGHSIAQSCASKRRRSSLSLTMRMRRVPAGLKACMGNSIPWRSMRRQDGAIDGPACNSHITIREVSDREWSGFAFSRSTGPCLAG